MAFSPKSSRLQWRVNSYTSLMFAHAACLSFSASATTYYVSHQGNDGNSGLSWSESWQTLAHAGSTAIAGDEVIVRKGDTAYKNLAIKQSGTQSQPIIFRGEDPENPPVISGAKTLNNPVLQIGNSNLWRMQTSAEPNIVTFLNTPALKASNDQCTDGIWFWQNNVLTVRTDQGKQQLKTIKRVALGGGIQTLGNSWIEIKNFRCELGGGACVSIKGGGHNLVENVYSRWQWRGIDIVSSSSNTIQNSFFTENREGIYIRANSNNNLIQNNRVIANGNAPLWTTSDRAGIAIGGSGVNVGNLVIKNEIAFNGGHRSDPALIAYSAPATLLRGNRVHENYGSGIFVTINSNGSKVIDNLVEKNGIPAVTLEGKNISGISVRRSNNVVVRDNQVRNNHVAPDSHWVGKDLGPRGGIDVRGNQGDNMQNIQIFNNQISDTVNGPDLYISQVPETKGLTVENNSSTPRVNLIDNNTK